MQDPTLLEIAWVELLEKNGSVTAEKLAEVLYFLGESWMDLTAFSFSDLSFLCR